MKALGFGKTQISLGNLETVEKLTDLLILRHGQVALFGVGLSLDGVDLVVNINQRIF
jgi:hypothetical protein